MKKVIAFFVTFIVLTGCVLAADSDSVKVTAKVDPKTIVAITSSAYTSPDTDPSKGDFNEGIGLGNISLGSTNSQIFYVSAKTNRSGALVMKLYGTALTLTSNNVIVDGAKVENGQAIDLTVNIVSGEEVSNRNLSVDNNTITFSTPATQNAVSAPTSGDCITFTEDPVGTGFRALTKALQVTADGSKAQAGDYVAYLTLDFQLDQV